MSSEIGKAQTRTYRKRRRAEQEEATRQRITEAAVDLHGTLGPARTTISAVAERAGVQRATVYRYFPDEAALFGACSAHWIAEHPPPDLTDWAAVEDPESRLHAALDDLYAWYEKGAEMLELIVRDAPVVPAMALPVEARLAYIQAVVETVMRGRSERGKRRRRVVAALEHALEFTTWRSLVGEDRLTSKDAADLMAELVALAARS